MKRALWTQKITNENCPAWTCPVCSDGKVRLRKGSLISAETKWSKDAHGEDFWGPEHVDYAFTAWADCTNDQCKQEFSISGRGGVEEYPGDEKWEYEDAFVPTSIYPCPNIIELPEGCPESIKEKVKSAFLLFLSDNEACANRLRSSVELLLTHVGVPTKDANGKSLSLHRRLEEYKKTNEELAEHLFALKWLGNSGSHGDDDAAYVSTNHLLDAFELMESVFGDILENKTEKLKKLSAKLIAAHKK